MKIFKPYDIRGIYPKDLNEEIAYKIGRAFGTFNPGKIVVGSDPRLSSPSLKGELVKGLMSTGGRVIDIGITTTPAVAISTRVLKCDGGIMVSGSHNPKEYNGFKLFQKQGTPIGYESGLNQIQAIFESERFSSGEGEILVRDILEVYSDFLLANTKVGHTTGIKVVVDAGNGSTGLIAPKILRKAGVLVEEMFCEPDGNFPNRQPNPSEPRSLVELQKKVLEVRADLGLAYDADGDRLVVVGESGDTVSAGVVFSVLIKNTLARNPGGPIIYTCVDSRAIEETIRSHGGVPCVSKVGNTFVAKKMVEEGGLLAGEISGHYFFKETFGADDAIFASLKLIEALNETGKTLSDHTREYPMYFWNMCKVPVKEAEMFNVIEHLKQDFEERGYQIDTLDGVKVTFQNCWALFRASNTEPAIFFFYEATDEENLEKIKKFVEDVKSCIPT